MFVAGRQRLETQSYDSNPVREVTPLRPAARTGNGPRSPVSNNEAGTSVGIDWLIAGARADAPLADREAWLARLVQWLHAGRTTEGAHAPETRLRLFLQVLERHPQPRLEAAGVLRNTLRELSAVDLLCETGLPRGNAFLQELGARITGKVLPTPPLARDLAALFGRLFPDAKDAQWVAALPAATVAELDALLRHGSDDDGNAVLRSLHADAVDALVILASHIQAIGLTQRVRVRAAAERPLDSPFAALSAAVRRYAEGEPATGEAADARAELLRQMARCARSLAHVRSDLVHYAVNTDFVYQLERARLSLKRMETIVALDGPDAPQTISNFVGRLIAANAAHASVGALLRDNTRLLSRRIVESARRDGEHYITRDGREQRAMIASAAIGGAVTAATVMIKLLVVGHGLPPFVEGFLASLNYAVSFVAIHLLHGTLATKQPATTATVLAAKLSAPAHHGRLRGFVAEVAALVRSQVAAIVGNLAVVAPVALLLQALVLAVGGAHLPAPADALHYIESLSIASATPLFAILTGVCLWLSSVAGGWFENWAAFRRLPEAIAQAPWLVRWLGEARAGRVAGAIDNNVSALGGNVALGVLLGMVPVVARFFGIPLEIPHVTLSTGLLALSAYAYGSGIVLLPAFWLAVAGIFAIGFMNLTVSFSLALWVAIKSTGVGKVSQARVRRAVLAHLVAAPRDFLLPPRAATTASPGA
jgi:site-specific recombinase